MASIDAVLRRFFPRLANPMERWDHDPLGVAPSATSEEYLALHEQARALPSAEVDKLEQRLGYAIDREWMDELALHTQVVIKNSVLNFHHGRVLYAVMRDFLARRPGMPVYVLETGTARGFSALCMSRALSDAGVAGVILTLDVLPHRREIYWNCIDDCEGRKTRESLLAAWQGWLEPIVFVQGEIGETLRRLSMQRVDFALLDAQHSYEAVMEEASYVIARQQAGDVIVFDDVTQSMFPGVVSAVDEIERRHDYTVQRISASEQRGLHLDVLLLHR